jgi:hypothetical protein
LIYQPSSRKGLTLVVLGISNPDEIEKMQQNFSDLEIKTILLDGRAEVIEERLRKRNTDKNVKADLRRVTGSTDKFMQDNSNFIPVLRETCRKHGCAIIDTSHLEPKTVAERVAEHLK